MSGAVALLVNLFASDHSSVNWYYEIMNTEQKSAYASVLRYRNQRSKGAENSIFQNSLMNETKCKRIQISKSAILKITITSKKDPYHPIGL